MATTERSGLPSVWVTTAAKILVGEQPCLLEGWVKARFNLEKREASSSLADYKIRHTALLSDEVDRLKAEGWRLTIERYFKIAGKFSELAGKPDLIAQLDGKRPKIVDVKGGKQRDSDTQQVKIYMVAIPMAWKSPYMQFEGEVLYGDGSRITVPAHEVGPTREKLFPLLKKLGTIPKPDPVPTVSNCQFCQVPDEMCGQRIQEATVAVATEEF